MDGIQGWPRARSRTGNIKLKPTPHLRTQPSCSSQGTCQKVSRPGETKDLAAQIHGSGCFAPWDFQGSQLKPHVVELSSGRGCSLHQDHRGGENLNSDSRSLLTTGKGKPEMGGSDHQSQVREEHTRYRWTGQADVDTGQLERVKGNEFGPRDEEHLEMLMGGGMGGRA